MRFSTKHSGENYLSLMLPFLNLLPAKIDHTSWVCGDDGLVEIWIYKRYEDLTLTIERNNGISIRISLRA